MAPATLAHQQSPPPANNIPLLTCAFLAALTTGGPVYAFGLYGGDLKASLELTQSQLDTISSANFCAGLLSWIPGLWVDQWGVRTSLQLGGVLGATFMMLYWAVATQRFALEETSSIIAALCFFGVCIFLSNALVIGSVFKILVSTCAPHTKGSAVGAAKGFVGLGSGVYATLFRVLPTTSDLDFLPLAALLAVLAGSLPAVWLLPSKNVMDRMLREIPITEFDQTTTAHLRCLYCGLILLAGLVVGTTLVSLLQDEYDNSVIVEDDQVFNMTTDLVKPQNPEYFKALVILFVWLAPILALLVLPPKSATLHTSETYEDIDDIMVSIENEHESDNNNNWEDDTGTGEFLPLVKTLSSPALAYGAEITASVIASGPRGILGVTAVQVDDTLDRIDNENGKRSNHHKVPDLTLSQMLQTTSAWLFAWVAVIRVGGGTMVTNNMGQMVESLHLPPQTTTPAALALFSVAQAVSRVFTGVVSDWALSWNIKVNEKRNNDQEEPHLEGVPRPVFLIVASLAGTLAHLFMSVTTTRNFFLLGVCFSGAAFGMIWPLMVLIVGEVFGTANMGGNYMFFDGLSSAMGTLLLSKYLTQEVYERHTSLVDGEESRTCYGQSCFVGAHIIIAGLSFSCAIASYWFYRCTRYVYETKAA